MEDTATPNQITPRNSIGLFRVNKLNQLNARIQELEHFCSQLQQENLMLRNEMQKIKTQNEENSAVGSNDSEILTNNSYQAEFETDEDELAKETEWIVNKNKRSKNKRNVNSPNTTKNSKKAILLIM